MSSVASGQVEALGRQVHELRFVSLFQPGRGVAVPCDASGQVDLNELPEKLRNAYLSAKAMVGRDYATPTVQPVH